MLNYKENNMMMSQALHLTLEDFKLDKVDQDLFLNRPAPNKAVAKIISPRSAAKNGEKKWDVEKCLIQIGFLLDLYLRNTTYNAPIMYFFNCGLCL